VNDLHGFAGAHAAMLELSGERLDRGPNLRLEALVAARQDSIFFGTLFFQSRAYAAWQRSEEAKRAAP
jgi:hypothetical protein